MDRETRTKWQSRNVAERYLSRRWKSVWRAQRDLRLLERAFERHGIGATSSNATGSGARGNDTGASGLRVLDAPCGAGRLHDLLRRRGSYVGIDVSASMLGVAGQVGAGPVARGDLARLPVRDGAFPLVVSCRILHHLDRPDLERVVAELVRVSSGWIVASFWDRGTFPALRSGLRDRLGARRRRNPDDRRRARSRAEIRAVFAAAGADVIGFEADTRLFSQQCFAIGRKR